MPKVFFVILIVVFSSTSFASRGYVGNGVITEVSLKESSGLCGSGECLLLYFEGGALGCSPSSSYIAISTAEPHFKSIEAMAFISLTSKKKFRVYATKESCADAALLEPNGASVYETAH